MKLGSPSAMQAQPPTGPDDPPTPYVEELEMELAIKEREIRELRRERDGARADTERLNALFTLMGGGYAFSPFFSLNELFRKGRRGIDELIKSNPSLLGSKQ